MNHRASPEDRLREALAQFRGAEAGEVERWRTALVLAFYAGDLPLAVRIVREALAEVDPVVVLDGVIAPAMADIGELWERNEITVADEHLATSLAQQLLADVAERLKVAEPEARAEKVLLAAIEPEQHDIPLLMANHVLYGAGYPTVMLGADVPRGALVEAAERHSPTVVVLSFTMPPPGSIAALVEELRAAVPDVRVLIGGRGVRSLPEDPGVRHVTKIGDLLQSLAPHP